MQTVNAQTVARILWADVESAVIAAGMSAPQLNMRAMLDDDITEWCEVIAANMSGHDEGEFRAALLNYRIVRDDPTQENDPDVLAHRDELLARWTNAANALDALQEVTGTEPDADDVAMARDADASALARWCDDLESRVGLDVVTFREALEPLQDDACERTCKEVAAVLAPLLTPARVAAGWRAQPVDMRGAHVGGSELYNPTTTDGVSFGIYRREDDGAWRVWDCYGEVDIDVAAAGGALDADKARATVRALIDDATPRAASHVDNAPQLALQGWAADAVRDAQRRAATLCPAAEMVAEKVRDAMDFAEGMYGPTGADYDALMRHISRDALQRIANRRAWSKA